jgi:hypothetical protein
LGSLWKGKLLDFRLVETFFENIKAFRSVSANQKARDVSANQKAR